MPPVVPTAPMPMTAQSNTAATKPVQAPGPTTSNSVIGQDLAIIGSGLKIVSKGLLQIDGEVQGDVICSKIIIGSTGKVTGLLNAEEIVVKGAVFGTIKAADVKLESSAQVEGDLYHQTFSLEQGARFEGRSRRSATRDELLPDFSSLKATD